MKPTPGGIQIKMSGKSLRKEERVSLSSRYSLRRERREGGGEEGGEEEEEGGEGRKEGVAFKER